ncbi:MAG: hypothetical protein JKX68_06055, partial [Flavobacteriales bacterium]|nr:hypothetical protein [Flavobacteriales bacterium]
MNWLKFRRYFVVGLISCCCNFANAQSPDDKISVENLNIKYLEHLTKIGIDSVRTAHQLTTLGNDSMLYNAAQYHAHYLTEKRILSHYQNDRPDTKTPTLRARLFGAMRYGIGENVAKSYFNKPLRDKKGKKSINKTYRQTANSLVTGWVNSPPHYANMITPYWQVTGVAISINPEKKEIKAVQKFGKVLNKYIFVDNTDFFPYSTWKQEKLVTSFDEVDKTPHEGKHAYKTKHGERDSPECVACNEIVDNAEEISLENVKGKMILKTDDVESMFKLINNRKDGFAIEIVLYEPYDCNNSAYYTDPSRRNEQCIYSGQILKPVFKKDLKKGFRSKRNWFSKIKKDEKVKTFKYKLGKLPKNIPGYYETNLVVIQKGKVCRIMHLNGFCVDPNLNVNLGQLVLEDFVHEFPIPPIKDLVPDVDKKSIVSIVPFERGRSDYDYTDVKPMIDTLTFDKFNVQKIGIKAFTSIEGSEAINKNLQLKRANSIVGAIEKEQKKEIPNTIASMPNWKLFHEQIKAHKELAALKGKSEDEIIEKLKSKDYVEEIEAFLAPQRRAEITMDIVTVINAENREAYLAHQFKTLIKDILEMYQKKKVITVEIRKKVMELLLLQNYICYNAEQGNIDKEIIKKIKVPNHLLFNSLKLNELWLESKYDKDYWKDEARMLLLYNRLKVQAFDNKSDELSTYNFCMLYTNLWKRLAEDQNQPKPSDVDPLVSSLIGLDKRSDKVSKEKIDTLLFNFNAKAVPYYFNNGEYQEVKERIKEGCTFILGFYAKDGIDEELAFKLAKYFMSYKQYGLAYQVMLPFVHVDEPHHGILMLFAKLSFEHPQEHPESNYADWLIKISNILTPEEWCPLFV